MPCSGQFILDNSIDRRWRELFLPGVSFRLSICSGENLYEHLYEEKEEREEKEEKEENEERGAAERDGTIADLLRRPLDEVDMVMLVLKVPSLVVMHCPSLEPTAVLLASSLAPSSCWVTDIARCYGSRTKPKSSIWYAPGRFLLTSQMGHFPFTVTNCEQSLISS